MNIVTYSNSDIRAYLIEVAKALDDSKKVCIPYKFWMEKFLPIMYKESRDTHSAIKPGVVRYTSTKTLFKQFKTVEQEIANMDERKVAHPEESSELDKKIFDILYKAFEPEAEFHYEGEESYNGLPIWFMSTRKEVNMLLGPQDLDMSQPTGILFNNDCVHSNLQGTTGCGKSVAIRTLVFNLLLIYPPWELDLNLIDNKGSESMLFAKKVKEAHCKSITATDAKDYLVDLYSSFAEENAIRQIIFQQADCSNISDFRTKFNLVLPRVIDMIDEFLQCLIAIENSETLGNKKASAELTELFNVLAKLGSLGRNAGLHFLISSQDLGSKLKSIVSKQIQSGIALACDSDISSSTINNSLASTVIDRKGMSIINTKRSMNDNSKYNRIVGIPFMDDSPIKGEQYTLPEKLLIELDAYRIKYNFYKEFSFYNSATKISSTRMYEAFVEASTEIAESPSATCLKIPLGETISYTNSVTACLTTRYKADEAIAIASSTDMLLKYIVDILTLGYMHLKGEKAKINLFYSDDSSLIPLEGTRLLANAEKTKLKLMNEKMFAIVENRMELMTLQDILLSAGLPFTVSNAFKVFSLNKYPRKQLFTLYENKLNESDLVYENRSIDEWLKQPIFTESSSEDKKDVLRILRAIYLLMATKSKLGLSDNEQLHEYALEPIINFWFNIEDIDNMFEDNIKAAYKAFLSNSGKVNVTNVVYSNMWSKLRSCIPAINYAIEFSNRDFVDDLALPEFRANVNADSLVIHDKRRSNNQLFKIYGGI